MSSYGVGSTVRITTTIRNDAGALTDPAAISLTVLFPDGETSPPYGLLTDPPVVRESLGVYYLDLETDLAGPYIARWAVTGPDTTEEQPFDVEPVWGESGIISLAEAKHHLKKRVSDTADDEKLQGFILAATDIIEDRMGHVLPVTVTEVVRPFRNTVVLRERPVVRVVTVQHGSSLAELPAEDRDTVTSGWQCSTEGVLESSALLPDTLRVTYVAGRVPVPFRIRLACKELTAHLWRTSQLNSDGGRPQPQGESQVRPSDFALPYNVRQLLGLNKAQRDMPAIG